jgi:heme oxygenase
MTILREATNAKHREVESLPMIQCIMNGPTVEQYVHYLFELQEIYRVIELAARSAGITNDLPGIERYERITEDLKELNPNYTRELMPSTKKYIDHIWATAYHHPNLLLAHVYVRHMGDLYGGKLMARVIPGSGRAYQFDDRPGIIKAFNDKLTMDLADEANLAFDYFIQIFDELYKSQN